MSHPFFRSRNFPSLPPLLPPAMAGRRGSTASATSKTGPLTTLQATLCWRTHLSFVCADVQYDHIRDLQSDLLNSNHTSIIFECYRNLKPFTLFTNHLEMKNKLCPKTPKSFYFIYDDTTCWL